jgi:hypothetical protein
MKNEDDLLEELMHYAEEGNYTDFKELFCSNTEINLNKHLHIEAELRTILDYLIKSDIANLNEIKTQGRINIVKFMLDNGADVNVPSYDEAGNLYLTPFQLCKKYYYDLENPNTRFFKLFDLFKYKISYGANIYPIIDQHIKQNDIQEIIPLDTGERCTIL